MKEPASRPDALLLTGKHCPYCPTVLRGLQALQADGVIGKLETVVIEDQPERAAELGVRSVPWVRIGPFELAGLRSEQELRSWAEKAGTEAGMAGYLDELLSGGNIDKGMALVRDNPGTLHALLLLLADPDTQLNTRIGISVIMESLENSARLQAIVDQLGELAGHAEASVRGDACHYLALSGSSAAIPYITPLLEDEDAGIREIAEESLERLKAGK
ncbi:MAG: HEAT repeat domain-containing protein [Gammaproteobacteria bacterium]